MEIRRSERWDTVTSNIPVKGIEKKPRRDADKKDSGNKQKPTPDENGHIDDYA